VSTQVLHSATDERFLGCPHAFFFYARLSDLLVVANSSLNVCVYCRFSRHFSRALRGGVPAPRRRRRRAAAFDDGLDSRRETVSRAVVASLPSPAPGGTVETLALVARGGPPPPPASSVTDGSLQEHHVHVESDDGATARHRQLTTVVTHHHDSV